MLRRRSIYVINSGNDWRGQRPHTDLELEREYGTWQQIAQPRHIDIYRGSIKWFSQGVFTKGWRRTRNGWDKVQRAIRPTVVYDRTVDFDLTTGAPRLWVRHLRHEINQIVRLYNPPEFTDLIGSKLYQAAIFRDFGPRTHFLQPGQTLRNPRGSRTVLKWPSGSGGDQVTITTARSLKVHQPLLQQEFVPAAKNGELRDVRIMCIGEQPQYVYARIAKPGSLYTNVHLGAHMQWLRWRDVQPTLKKAREILQVLEPFTKKICTLDFLVHSRTGRSILIEANTMPGSANFGFPLLRRLLSNMTDYLLEE